MVGDIQVGVPRESALVRLQEAMSRHAGQLPPGASAPLMLHHVIYWRQALAESSRVLKPGGEFLGYDLTDTRLARWVHQVDGSPHRIIAPDELIDGLQGAGFTRITVQTAAHGHLMRFHAHKPA